MRFVSVTSGDAGHHTQGGGMLAARRRAEAQEAGRRIGIDYEVLDNHDGELLPTLKVREQIIRLIRQWKADLVLGPAPERLPPGPPLHRRAPAGCGLHGDRAERDTRHAVADEEPGLHVLRGRLPEARTRSRPDVAVSIDDTFAKKIDMLDAHVSQVYEWLPWHAGKLDAVPKDAAARKAWLATERGGRITPAVRAALRQVLRRDAGAAVKYAEAFELCEYGRRADEAEIAKLFPFLRK